VPVYAITSSSPIGLLCQSVTPDTAREVGLDTPRGMIVVGVTAGSAAAMAGIHSSDVLLKINGTEMRDLSGLRAIAAETAPGQPVPVEIYRRGTVQTVRLQVDQLRR
jgi:serine protease Do